MKILIVEDEQDLRETIRTSLLKEKFVVETAADYFSALDKINDYDYDCILLDIMLPGGSGLDLLRELKHLRRTDSVLIISANESAWSILSPHTDSARLILLITRLAFTTK